MFHIDCPPGDVDALATLNEARDRIRRMSVEEKSAGVRVELGAGVWRLAGQFRLDAADSGTPVAPIVWSGSADGESIVKASRVVPVSSFVPVVDDMARSRIDPAVVDSVRVADISHLAIEAPPTMHRELALVPLEIPDVFCDGKWLPCARWPRARARALGPRAPSARSRARHGRSGH